MLSLPTSHWRLRVVMRNSPVRDKNPLFITIHHRVLMNIPHCKEEFRFNSCFNLPFYPFHGCEIGFTLRTIRNITFSGANRVSHPVGVTVQADPVQQSSVGRFRRESGSLLKPCLQSVACCCSGHTSTSHTLQNSPGS